MTGSITRLVEDWQAGDEQAAYDLERRFRAYLLALVRRKRPDNLRHRIETEGVFYAALKSFLSGLPKGEFPAVHNRTEARRILTAIAVNTLRDEVRAANRQKRDARRDVSLDPAALAVAPGPVPVSSTCVCAADGGDCTEELSEFLENLIERVRSVHPKAISILEFSLEGLSNNDIADEIGLGVRRVQLIKKAMFERIVAHDEEPK